MHRSIATMGIAVVLLAASFAGNGECRAGDGRADTCVPGDDWELVSTKCAFAFRATSPRRLYKAPILASCNTELMAAATAQTTVGTQARSINLLLSRNIARGPSRSEVRARRSLLSDPRGSQNLTALRFTSLSCPPERV